MISRQCGVAVLLLLLVPVVAWAGDPAPLVLVRQTTDRMIAALEKDSKEIDTNPERLYELVDEIVLPHFDFERMSKLVLGKYWRQASADQRSRFTSEFRTLLVRTYATSMKEYSDQKITFLPVDMTDSDTDVTVKTEVEQSAGFPVPIDYTLYLKDGEWKVYEVAVDGVNLVINYRTSFAAEIRKPGGIDALIDTMSKRNRQAMHES